MLRELATALLLASLGRALFDRRFRHSGGLVLSLIALQLLELQFQLLDLAFDALRRGAKRHALQTRELELELLGFQRFVDQTGLGRVALGNRSIPLDLEGIALDRACNDELLQRIDIVGKIGGDRHAASSICFAPQQGRVTSSRSTVIPRASVPTYSG